MALARNVYADLEDIVGRDNISEEPAILDSYCHYFRPVIKDGVVQLWNPRPEAVVLPGSTEEVQAIVKTCNRNKIQFKAMSTGWSSINAVPREGVIQIDLRRMNRILEINEKGMYAVVEPYVISAQLQAELMKRGLDCNIIDAGSNTSALAPIKCYGLSACGVSHGNESRNVLATEWVLPTGEVLRLGSLGSGAGWFCGDGPGPSLRGIMRGFLAPMSGLGVTTKGAVKLYHWSGPRHPQIEGVSPNYELKLTPETFLKIWFFSFPSLEELGDAGYKLGESKIAEVLVRHSIWKLAWFMTTSTDDAMKMISELTSEIKDREPGLIVIIAAGSRSEFDYKEKVLQQIMAETGGESLALIQDPRWQKQLLWDFIRVSGTSRAALRPTGAFSAIRSASSETLDLALNQERTEGKLKKKLIESGFLLYDLGYVHDSGHLADFESMVVYHRTVEAVKTLAEYQAELNEIILNREGGYPCGGMPLGMGNEHHDLYGPYVSNYHLWLRKIKKAFDPNITSESSGYITPRE